MKKENNYLFVDCGNTNIKAGIYSIKNKIVKDIHFIPNNQPIISLLDQFKNLNKYNISKVFVVSTIGANKTNTVMKQLHEIFSADVKLIVKEDFKGLINLNNVSKDIGTDILLLGLYGSLILPKSLIVSLGSVYSAIVMDNNKYESVLLLPSISKSLANISNQSTISSNLIPTKYNKTIGLNTKDCFAAGANLMMEGLVDNICKTYNVGQCNVFITGGDCNKYLNITKKYKVIDNLTLKAISLLIK